MKKNVLIIMMLAFSFFPLKSQTLAKNDELKFDADYYMMEKDFNKALNNYLTILKSEPENADIKYRVGICYLNAEEGKEKAIPYLEEAALKVSEKHNPSSFKETNAPVDALFLLGSAYRINNQIDQAIDAYTRYKSYLDPKDDYNLKVTEQYLKSCEMARTMQQNPVALTATNIGRPINSEIANFNPVVSGDGKTLFYTSTGRQGYDIFMSTYQDTAWSAPRNLTSSLGTGKYMKTCDLSFDGLTLLLALDDPMNSDIFVCRLTKGRWSKAEPLGKEINSKYNETHASLTTDGKTLYFTSDRKGGEGDFDIYKSELDSKGDWGKPVNLGPIINTPFNEATPFMTEIGDKLFFSSEGHDGIGGYDIFYYDFSSPLEGVVNPGYPLNTTDNDLFYVPAGDGTTAYYAFSGKDSYGARDIYKMYVPEKVEEVEEPVAAAVAAAVEEPVAAAVAAAVEEPVAAAVEEPVAVAVEEPVAVEEAAAAVEVEEPVKEPVAAAVAAVVEEPVAVGAAASYKIQVMALKKPVDLTHFNGLSGVSLAYYSNDKWYRYTLGSTSNMAEAEKMLSEVISRGYRDAFIRKSTIDSRFTIQVMAVPGPVVNLNQFSGLSEVFVTRGNDNFCRYTTGEYVTKEEALSNLQRIKALGYKTAFVTRVR